MVSRCVDIRTTHGIPLTSIINRWDYDVVTSQFVISSMLVNLKPSISHLWYLALYFFKLCMFGVMFFMVCRYFGLEQLIPIGT
jgi:bacteriorhodopsin